MKLDFKPINIDGSIKKYKQLDLLNFLYINDQIQNILSINCPEEIILSLLMFSFEENIGLSILKTNNFLSEFKENILIFRFQFLILPKSDLKNINFNKYKILFKLVINEVEYNIIQLVEIGQELEFKKSILLFTSGSSGVRKIVKISHKAIISCSKFMAKKMKMIEQDKEVIYAQLDHAFCLGRIISCGLVSNPFCFLSSSQMLKPSSIEKIMDLKKLSGLSTMPSVLFSILSIEKYSQNFSNKLRYIQMGGMFLPPERKKFIIEKLPKTKIFLNYGMTEYMRATFFDISKYTHKLNTEGIPADDTEIKISNYRNFNDTDDLGDEKIGEILIKGAHLCDGYINKKEWTKRITKEGFFKTGDLGFIDEDGFLIHKGRLDKTFNFQGKLFNSDNLENQLLKKYSYLKDKITIIPIRKENSLKDYEVFVCIIKKEISTIDKNEEMIVKKFFRSLGLTVAIKYFEVDFPRTQNGKISFGEIKKVLLDQN